ncbi:MAG: hypothetical protein V4674_02715 [Patescibacteria group bacterium]
MLKASMHTKVISLKGVEYEGEAKRFTVKTELGEVTVLNHHRPFATVLVAGTAELETQSGEPKTFSIAGGFLHMDTANVLTVLVDEAVLL